MMSDIESRQLLASDPNQNVWVSANAGTGKTHVLVQRIVRLMLEGVSGEKILCLTYTRAAAGEMLERVVDTLAAMTVLPDDKLIDKLISMGINQPSSEQIKKARTLLAASLEVRGGMKFLTFHSFCERVLRQFIVEADVPSGFNVIDDKENSAIIQSELSKLLSKCKNPNSYQETQIASAYADCIGKVSELTSLIKTAVEDKALEKWLLDNAIEKYPQVLFEALNLEGGLKSPEEYALLWEDSYNQYSELLHNAKAIAIEYGGKTVVQNAQKLELSNCSAGQYRNVVKDLCLTQEGKPRARNPLFDKKCEKANPELGERLNEWFLNSKELLNKQAIEETINLSASFLVIVANLIDAINFAKKKNKLLNYNDLIDAVVRLFADKANADWVMYKLDNRIDHILIDEAQDTSPAQWQIIRNLCLEFFTGLSSRSDTNRTIFVVGDPKQSIYSFQGAKPEQFGGQLTQVGKQVDNAGKPFSEVSLNTSFRSGGQILDLVNRVFNRQDLLPSLVFEGQWHDHKEFTSEKISSKASIVEIWGAAKIEKQQKIDVDYLAPVDVPKITSPAAMLAEDIADTIANWLKEKREIKGLNRPVRPGDILLLVKKRLPMLGLLTNALKQRSIPVARVDRISLDEDPAVKDLLSLAKFSLQQFDDLSLAEALRSPLFECSEDELFTIAHNRGKESLYNYLKTLEKPKFQNWVRNLSQLIKYAQSDTPFEFFSKLMGELDGWQKLQQRLGTARLDAIEEFISQSLAASNKPNSNLGEFIQRFADSDNEIKVEPEISPNEVRILTTHGAKGLEAEIVMIADGPEKTNLRHFSRLVWIDSQKNKHEDQPQKTPPQQITAIPLWCFNKEDRERLELQSLEENWKANQWSEVVRLLYVALTRARRELYYCPFVRPKTNSDDDKKDKNASEGSHYNWQELLTKFSGAASSTELSEEQDVLKFISGREVQIKRWHSDHENADTKLLVENEQTVPSIETDCKPQSADFLSSLRQQKNIMLQQPNILKPSYVHDQKEAAQANLFDDDKLRKLSFGKLVHELIENLLKVAPEFYEACANKICDKWRLIQDNTGLSDKDFLTAIDQALGVMALPEICELKKSRLLTEVPILAEIDSAAGRQEISGRIDALFMPSKTKLIFCEFKSGDGFLSKKLVNQAKNQALNYKFALQKVFEGAKINGYIVWVKTRNILLV